MRTFVAIELPVDIQTRIEDMSHGLGYHLASCSLGRAVRWTPAAKLHITLRFLGDTSPSQQRQLGEGLSAQVQWYSPSQLCVAQVGCFPNMCSPRVIWRGLEGDLSRLIRLQSDVEQVAQRAGYEAESRSYSPHLTIGRVRRDLPKHERHKLGNCLSDLLEREGVLNEAGASSAVQCLDFDVHSLVLMRSVLKQKGAQYTVLERFQLG
jgi:2'-5' RNA ligase